MIKPLTSLRFIFAFMVLMSHANIFESGGHTFFYHLFYEGYVGVSFFFILSGFILSYSYEQRLKQKLVSLRTFYVARLARIYPLHILTMVIWMWMRKDVPLDFTYITNFTANIFLLQSYYPLEGIKFNAASWSLSNEMFFYLLFPFLLVWFSKSKRSFLSVWAVLGIAVVGLCYFLQNVSIENWLFYASPYFRIVDFVLGICLYKFCQKAWTRNFVMRFCPTLLEALSVVILVSFYCAAYFVPQVYRNAVWYWIPVGILICVFYFGGGRISRLLSSNVWVLLGEISFSLYMFHGIVLWYTRRMLQLTFNEISLLAVFCIGAVLSTMLSYVVFRFFEGRANKFVKRILNKSK